MPAGEAEQLRAAIQRSVLHIVAGAGHMVHHLAASQVAAAVEAVADLASLPHAANPPAPFVIPTAEGREAA